MPPFPHNFVPSAAGTVAALAPFGFVEPRIGQPSFVQPSSSSTASVQSPSPSPSPPESIEEEPARPKTARGYGKWSEQEETLLVQLRCDKHMWLETRHSRQLWEEIAKEISKTGNVTSAQCQRKSKYLEDRYKEAKDHNHNHTGGNRKTSPFYNKIGSVLGWRDIVTFSYDEEFKPSTSVHSSDFVKSHTEKDKDKTNLGRSLSSLWRCLARIKRGKGRVNRGMRESVPKLPKLHGRNMMMKNQPFPMRP